VTADSQLAQQSQAAKELIAAIVHLEQVRQFANCYPTVSVSWEIGRGLSGYETMMREMSAHVTNHWVPMRDVVLQRAERRLDEARAAVLGALAVNHRKNEL
jgi:hypothetical protein